MRQKFKPWAKPYILENAQYDMFSETSITKYHHFTHHILEIGMGKGDFLHAFAKSNKEIFFTGVEVNPNCGAVAMKKCIDDELENVSFLIKDAKDLIKCEQLGLKFDVIYLNFPDPWPKKRHNKRRLTAPIFMSLYRTILKKDGKVILKTDNLDFFEDSLVTFSSLHLKILSVDRNLKISSEPMSAYEMKYRSDGKTIYKVEVMYAEDRENKH